MIYRTVTVKPRLINPVVRVAPSVSQNIVRVKADVVTKLTYSNAEMYDGAYEVTPRAFDEQVLATRDKQMADDVTVHRVPYFETSNENGTTVYIAEA